MADYKHTLNLPQTDFPMKASLAQREPNMLQFWDELNLYQRLREQGQDRPSYVLHDGPPYANGNIHMGTTLNKVLKDIVVKSKTLSGFNAPYVPGWDCHGLPIELKVEKKKGKAGVKLSHKEFRQACREYATQQVALQKSDFIRLGILGEWDNPYLTMNPKYEANIVRALAKMVEAGHLARGFKPVHWCTACGSALAEAEVEYQDKTSPAIDVAFAVCDVNNLLERFQSDVSLKGSEVFVPIWTTTPWTLPANQAVSMHPEFLYVLVECELQGKTVYLILAKELLETVMQRYQAEDYRVLAEVKGGALENVLLQHPFLERQVPVILGDHVTAEAGTGNVHTAPAHGVDDYKVGRQYQLPEDNPVDSRSCFIEGVPIVAGLHVFKANEPIIETLKNSGHLLHHESLTHSYPHCWRHKTPLIFRATPQWFISMDQGGLRKQALKAIQQTHWVPAWGENRLSKMIESRPDWCISRQRSWGVPIALFVHKQTQALHPRTVELMEQAASLIEEGGIDAWFDLDPKTLLGDEADEYDKVTDTTDVWLDSGVSHFAVLEQREQLHVPADLYLEGSDQHRGWFQTSLLTSLCLRNAAPFKSVLTHGYVVDGKGMKMSKSVGNTVEPNDVVKKLGADILRLWSAACEHTGDVNYSDEIIKRTGDAYRRMRNTARFLLSNLHDFDPAKDAVSPEELVALDRWAIVATHQLQNKIIEAYDRFHFQSIYQMILNFCTVELGSFYLDIIKDRMYTAKTDSMARRSAQTAMFHILQALVRWLAPVLSFTAEEIWQHMPGEHNESVFLNTWYDAFPVSEDQSVTDWAWIMQVRDAVNKVLEAHRKAGDIGSALDADVLIYADAAGFEKLAQLKDELRFVLITSEAHVMPMSEAEGAQATDVEGVQVKVLVSKHPKCARCWQRREDVGQEAAHAELCGRCVVNIEGAGEQREFA